MPAVPGPDLRAGWNETGSQTICGDQSPPRHLTGEARGALAEHLAAHPRVHAVAADQHVAFHFAAGKIGAYASGVLFDRLHACVGSDLHPQGLGGVEQHGLQVGAMHLEIWRPPPALRRRAERSGQQQAAIGAVADVDLFRHEADLADFTLQSQPEQTAGGVRRELQSCAYLGEGVGLLQHHRPCAPAGEGDGRRQAADPSADQEHA